MGRETRILLALLGLLVGVFLGVVSLKLFVPRPPAGVGPDVHADIASVEAQDLVEPPELTPPLASPLASPPPPADDPYAGRTSRFAADDAVEPPLQDPFVRPASFEPAERAPAAELHPEPQPESQPAAIMAEPVAAEPFTAEPVTAEPAELLPPPSLPLGDPPAAFPSPAAGPPPSPSDPGPAASRLAGVHVTQPGDSWWSLAERAYGDGRLYRALFAWNKALEPRVSLAPGTRLEIPPAARLAAAWPGLVPQD
jgi:hypothetical protein